jgi:hypothetical protein
LCLIGFACMTPVERCFRVAQEFPHVWGVPDRTIPRRELPAVAMALPIRAERSRARDDPGTIQDGRKTRGSRPT